MPRFPLSWYTLGGQEATSPLRVGACLMKTGAQWT